MCMLCVEIMKGKMTPPEIIRADRELDLPHTDEELKNLAEYIERERPDLKDAIIQEYQNTPEKH